MARFNRIGFSSVAGAMALMALFAGPALAKPFTYINARFGTVCAFPDKVFNEPMPEPENGDGQQWRSPDGASLACYGSYNALDETPASLVAGEKASTQPGYKVTYAKTGKNWAVVSGTDGDMIFYARSVFGKKDVLHTVRIEYPASLKAKYDPLVGAIAGSLHEATGSHWE